MFIDCLSSHLLKYSTLKVVFYNFIAFQLKLSQSTSVRLCLVHELREGKKREKENKMETKKGKEK